MAPGVDFRARRIRTPLALRSISRDEMDLLRPPPLRPSDLPDISAPSQPSASKLIHALDCLGMGNDFLLIHSIKLKAISHSRSKIQLTRDKWIIYLNFSTTPRSIAPGHREKLSSPPNLAVFSYLMVQRTHTSQCHLKKIHYNA